MHNFNAITRNLTARQIKLNLAVAYRYISTPYTGVFLRKIALRPDYNGVIMVYNIALVATVRIILALHTLR